MKLVPLAAPATAKPQALAKENMLITDDIDDVTRAEIPSWRQDTVPLIARPGLVSRSMDANPSVGGTLGGCQPHDVGGHILCRQDPVLAAPESATSMDAYSELTAIDVDVYLPNLLQFQIRKRLRKCCPWFRKPFPNGMVFLLVRVSRGDMSLGVRIRVSSRPQHPREHADVWGSSILRTRFEDGAVEIVWDELVAFDHRTLEQALSTACQQEGEMEQYLEEKKASQKRPATPFQRPDMKKAAFQSPQRPVASGSSQVPSQHSPSGQKECPHCRRAHGGTKCWKLAGKCLKCRSSEHRIKDCPRLQKGGQRGAALAPAAAAVAPVTGRLGRARAPARVFALAHRNLTAGAATFVTVNLINDHLHAVKFARLQQHWDEILEADKYRWVRLHVVGVVFLLVRVSRGEMSLGVRIRVSSRPQHPRDLCFPHRHQ
ncbi:hypothetical protein Taro_000472 [Colocasia esculenta]|uniref:CCHC-type domain-containing protein n=1 Tax=Colocasia esculenta TaxID=4460 RepID=A0A843TD68_COLES|nr:hypothetical protein [Colocasia esculenta]